MSSDVSSDMHSLTVSHEMPFTPDVLYGAWTAGWGAWFAEPDSLRVRAFQGEPFYFEVEQRFTDGTPSKRHPHYGRFLTLEPNVRVSFTWFTGGTGGVPTVVTVAFAPNERRTTVTLTHEGFGSAAARDAHANAWPHVLAQQESKLAALSPAQRSAMATRTGVSGFPVNRSVPDATFIPVRSYPDLEAAVTWLHDVLGCEPRLRIPGHRVQMTLGNGAVIAREWDAAANPATGGRPPATLMVRVRDIDATYARALAHGATSIAAPETHPFGERQAQIRDPAGHAWSLTQTVADVDPASWGGELVT